MSSNYIVPKSHEASCIDWQCYTTYGTCCTLQLKGLQYSFSLQQLSQTHGQPVTNKPSWPARCEHMGAAKATSSDKGNIDRTMGQGSCTSSHLYLSKNDLH